jgi:hypothetical protein
VIQGLGLYLSLVRAGKLNQGSVKWHTWQLLEYSWLLSLVVTGCSEADGLERVREGNRISKVIKHTGFLGVLF